VVDAIRQYQRKMSEKDQYCCLLFDEMAIRENATCAQQWHNFFPVGAQSHLNKTVVGVSWQISSTVFLYHQPLHAWLLNNKT